MIISNINGRKLPDTFAGRKATSTIRAVNRIATLVHVDTRAVQMREKLTQYKEESEKVRHFPRIFGNFDLKRILLQEVLEVCLFLVQISDDGA